MSGSQPTRPGALKHARSPQGSPNPGEAKAKGPRVGDEVGMDVGAASVVPGGVAGSAGEVGTLGLPGGLPDMPLLLPAVPGSPFPVDVEGAGAPPGIPQHTPEPKLSDIMAEMQKMNLNNQTNFSNLQQQVASQAVVFTAFTADLANLRAEMISEPRFVQLEQEVQKLKQGGLPNKEMHWMQDQINRLDPANKCLALKGITEFDLTKRTAAIDALIRPLGVTPVSIDHVWTGPPGNRRMGPISLVEFSSRTSREAVLKTLGGDKTTNNTDIGPILFIRAQTSMQRKRNSALGAAFDLLKKDPRCRNKIPKIEWKIEGSKNR